jgi:hypothetical protein
MVLGSMMMYWMKISSGFAWLALIVHAGAGIGVGRWEHIKGTSEMK